MNTKKFAYLFSILVILLGIALQPNLEVFSGLASIVTGKDGATTDFFVKATVGTALLNGGLVGLIGTIIMDIVGSDFDSDNLATIGLFIGFSFFGKNILNIWPFIFGGFLFSRVNKIPFKDIINTTLYSTTIAPLFSEILYLFDLPFAVRVPLALVVGISLGYLLHITAKHISGGHKGYSLYNTGLNMGLLGMIYVSLFKSYGFTFENQLLWDTNKNINLYIIFMIISVIILAYGLFKDKGIKNYMRLLNTTGKNASYIEDFGLDTVFISMGALGIYTLSFLFILDIPLNGPILGGVISIMLFAGAGKHVKNLTPIFLGVLLGGLTSVWNMSDPTAGVAFVFLTGLAPLAGSFGFLPGLLAAFITASVARNTGTLHGGMVLYNMGFSIGLVCLILVPLYEKVFPKALQKNQDKQKAALEA